MIDVRQYRAAVDATKGDAIVIPKSQLSVLLTECEAGQHARRMLVAVAAIAASPPRVAA